MLKNQEDLLRQHIDKLQKEKLDIIEENKKLEACALEVIMEKEQEILMIKQEMESNSESKEDTQKFNFYE